MDHAQVKASEAPRNHERRAGLIPTLAVLSGVGIAALTGCAPDAGAAPAPTSSTSAEGKPSATPTTAPETQAPTNEHKFSGTVNYDSLLPSNWAELNELDQQAACREFFASNIEGEPTLTAFSTGVEVTQWFKNRMLVVQDLVMDKSDPRNAEVARNLADCMGLSYIHNEEKSTGQQELAGQFVGLAQSSLDGDKLIFMEPDQITRYSDGTFPATAKHDLSYAALSVEGRLNNGFGDVPGQLVMNYYQWSPDEQMYRFVITTPTEEGGVNPYFGTDNPPVVLDPTRQDAPNTLDNSSFED